MSEMAIEGQKIARWPIHPSRPHKVLNMHEPTNNKIVDPYHWIQNMSEEDKNLFKREEEEYYQLNLLKHDMLHK